MQDQENKVATSVIAITPATESAKACLASWWPANLSVFMANLPFKKVASARGPELTQRRIATTAAMQAFSGKDLAAHRRWQPRVSHQWSNPGRSRPLSP
jgi:hypothetical protein